MTFQKQGPPLKRPLESEEGPQTQQQYLVRLHELQSASDTGLADITKPQSSFQTGVLMLKTAQNKMSADPSCCVFFPTTRWQQGIIIVAYLDLFTYKEKKVFIVLFSLSC